MSGLELAGAIFQSQAIPHKPLVVGLTADTSKAMVESCMRSGMKMVLHKPLTTNQLKDFFGNIEAFYS